MNPHQENNTNDILSELFSHPWFLIELGNQLIYFGDRELINILCLNRKINQQATSIFRQHFLNFELQKEFQKLFFTNQFEKAQQLFERNRLCLNPDLKITFQTEHEVPQLEIPSKHVNNFFNYSNDFESDSQRAERLTVHFISVCLRVFQNSDSLIRSIFFHPRMNRLLISDDELNQLLYWTILKGYHDMFDLICEKEKRKIDWEAVVVSSIVFQRIEILRKVTKMNRVWNRYSHLGSYKIRYLNLSAQVETSTPTSQTDFFELLLKSKLFEPTDPTNIFLESLKLGHRFTAIVVKNVIERYDDFHCFSSCTETEIRNAIDLLYDSVLFDQNKESGTFALKLAFLFGQFDKFKFILKETNPKEEIVLVLIQKVQFRRLKNSTSKTNYLEIVESILNHLNAKNPKLEEKIDFQRLLKYFLNDSHLDCFQFIWKFNNFLSRGHEWIHKFFLDHFPYESGFFSFLISQCLASVQTTYCFSNQSSQVEDFKITSEFRNIVFILSFRMRNEKFISFELIEEKLQIKWTQQLLDWCLKFVPKIKDYMWLLKNERIDKSFWNAKNVHFLLMKSCEKLDSTLFDTLWAKFPNTDLTANNNEALRMIVNQDIGDEIENKICSMFGKFESKIRFKNKEERDSLKGLPWGKRIAQMKLINE